MMIERREKDAILVLAHKGEWAARRTIRDMHDMRLAAVMSSRVRAMRPFRRSTFDMLAGVVPRLGKKVSELY